MTCFLQHAQLAIDRWAINATLPPASLDPGSLMDLFIAELSMLGSPVSATRAALTNLAASDAPAHAALVDNVTSWMGMSEAFAPQNVDFVPFPFFGFSSRPFYSLLIPLFAFFFLFTVILRQLHTHEVYAP